MNIIFMKIQIEIDKEWSNVFAPTLAYEIFSKLIGNFSLRASELWFFVSLAKSLEKKGGGGFSQHPAPSKIFCT